MLDGIDGSGKGTIIKAWKEYLKNSGNAFFDLTRYCKENGHYPKLSELNSYNFIITGEPTYVETGKLIREELLKKGKNYNSKTIAEAFSLDRAVLYKKIIIPSLKQGKIIIQDRGISSTLAYQPLADKNLKISYLKKLSGNELALKNSPDYLVLLSTDPREAMARLEGREDKQDDSIFEKLDFLKKLDHVYQSKKYQKLFTKQETKILQLNGNQKIGIMKEEAVELLKKILNTSTL